jgi:hypothetical protein
LERAVPESYLGRSTVRVDGVRDEADAVSAAADGVEPERNGCGEMGEKQVSNRRIGDMTGVLGGDVDRFSDSATKH